MIKKYGLAVMGMVIGGVLGYLYYHYVGCSSGNCLITSQPINSTIYGAVMGGLGANLFQK